MLSSLFFLDIKPPYKSLLWLQEDFTEMLENYREKELLTNAESGNAYTGMAGNAYRNTQLKEKQMRVINMDLGF